MQSSVNVFTCHQDYLVAILCFDRLEPSTDGGISLDSSSIQFLITSICTCSYSSLPASHLSG